MDPGSTDQGGGTGRKNKVGSGSRYTYPQYRSGRKYPGCGKYRRSGEIHQCKKAGEVPGGQPRNKEIVIYCGCCPLSGCPNIEPAYRKLEEMKFSNFKILDLPQDLQEDWIDKGYPMNAGKQ